MGNRTTTKSNQTQNQNYNSASTYDFLNPPDTADTAALRDHKFQIDPTIGYRVGGAIRRSRDSYNNPLGGNTTPQIRDAAQRSQEREIMQEGGAQFRAGAFDANNAEYAKKLAVAGMTAPRMVQTGQSGTSTGTNVGTSSTGEPWYNAAIQGASALGQGLVL